MMNCTELFNENKLLLGFMRSAYLEVYPDSKLKTLFLDMFEEDTNDRIAFYSEEYNDSDSCHCHPQATRFSFLLPRVIANSLNPTIIAAYLRDEKERVDTERKTREDTRRAKEGAEREAAQRKQFEILKKKYEG